MKNLLNLEGVKALSKMQQKSINGGVTRCTIDEDCPSHMECAIIIGAGYGYCQAKGGIY